MDNSTTKHQTGLQFTTGQSGTKLPREDTKTAETQHVYIDSRYFGLIRMRKTKHNKRPSVRSLLVTASLLDDYFFIPRFPSIYQKYSPGAEQKDDLFFI